MKKSQKIWKIQKLRVKLFLKKIKLNQKIKINKQTQNKLLNINN